MNLDLFPLNILSFQKGMHYVIMTDPGISGSEEPGGYLPYDLGVKEDVFVKNSTDQIFIGKVRKIYFLSSIS